MCSSARGRGGQKWPRHPALGRKSSASAAAAPADRGLRWCRSRLTRTGSPSGCLCVGRRPLGDWGVRSRTATERWMRISVWRRCPAEHVCEMLLSPVAALSAARAVLLARCPRRGYCAQFFGHCQKFLSKLRQRGFYVTARAGANPRQRSTVRRAFYTLADERAKRSLSPAANAIGRRRFSVSISSSRTVPIMRCPTCLIIWPSRAFLGSALVGTASAYTTSHRGPTKTDAFSQHSPMKHASKQQLPRSCHDLR
jgi:hypothetical protein